MKERQQIKECFKLMAEAHAKWEANAITEEHYKVIVAEAHAEIEALREVHHG